MSEYWQRRNKEMEHIRSTINSDAEYSKALKDIYVQSERNVSKEIDSFLMNYAGREQISMDEARKRVAKFDVEAYKSKAKKYVEEKNFSPRANEELRLYNVKMKMNRLQLLNENLRLEGIALADAEDKLLTARLNDEVYNEIVRQAGILGETVPDHKTIKRLADAVVLGDFKGTNFSNRIWSNQQELQSEVEKSVRKVLIQGKNPRVAAKDLRKLVRDSYSNKQYAANRISITESARAQSEAQVESFKEFDIDKMEWIAEPDACEDCADLDGSIISVGGYSYGSATIPYHPNCRCSYAAYVERSYF